jgi:hypothetical protein
MIETRSRSNSGMALPMVLWSIALLTGVVLLLAGIIEGWVNEETRSGKLFRARTQALSGIALAMNPGVPPGDPILHDRSKDRCEGYDVVITDESGLINPNSFLNPDHRDLFGRLFTAWGLDKNSCDTVADGLYDWQSPSPFRSLHGAKKEDYEGLGMSGLPPGAPFVSPEEMALVIGFDAVIRAKANWKSYFTTYSANGINILYAPKGVLTDFFGLTSAQADSWIALRNGKDGIAGTDDDFNGKTPDLKTALQLMGLPNPPQNITSVLTAAPWGSLRHIESTGYCNGVKYRITIIAPGGSTQNPQGGGSVLGWSEQ